MEGECGEREGLLDVPESCNTIPLRLLIVLLAVVDANMPVAHKLFAVATL